MKRRTLLMVGATTGTLLALAGGTLALLGPGLKDGRLSPAGRGMFSALAVAMLADMLPAEAASREREILAYLERLDEAIAACQPPVQAEIDELVTLLASPPGRLALVGLGSDWAQAPAADVQARLQVLRHSSLALRQQVYQALHKLVTGPYFAGPTTWQAIGYPGPRPV